MWISVARKKEDIKYGKFGSPYIDDVDYPKYFFDKDLAQKLEKDGFLIDMWNKFDSVLDWGDCDFFFYDKCTELKKWSENKYHQCQDIEIKDFYKRLIEFSSIAIDNNTGIYFDF